MLGYRTRTGLGGDRVGRNDASVLVISLLSSKDVGILAYACTASGKLQCSNDASETCRGLGMKGVCGCLKFTVTRKKTTAQSLKPGQ